jgi:hypothetical protein
VDADTQRGILQIVLAACLIAFGGIILIQTWRTSTWGWPFPWGVLTSSFLLVLGVWIGMHALYWLDVITLSLQSPVFLVTGWLAVVLAVWAFVRWIRVSGEG